MISLYTHQDFYFYCLAHDGGVTTFHLNWQPESDDGSNKNAIFNFLNILDGHFPCILRHKFVLVGFTELPIKRYWGHFMYIQQNRNFEINI